MRKLVATLALVLVSAAARAVDLCPANPPLRIEKGAYHVPGFELTSAEFDAWLGNTRFICQNSDPLTQYALLAGRVGQTLTSNVTGNLTGNASTATALAANGTNCSAGNYPLGVDASGNAEGCTTVTSGSSIILDLADDGSNESTGILEIATSASNSIFSEPSADKFFIDLSQPWPTASALAANGSNCSAGQWAAGVSASGVAEGCTVDDDVPEAGDFGALALTGDVTSSGLTTTLANIPTATPAAGTIVHTNIAAPSSPASGKDAVYSDSTDLRLHDKNASGVIGTTVVADAGASNNFLTAISAAGAISKARPTCGNLSDSTLCAATDIPLSTYTVTGSGPASRCAQFDASHHLVEFSADCGSGGSGDSIRVEDGDNAGTFTAMVDADFDDSGDINFVRTAGPPDVITGTVRANSVALTTDTTGNYAAGDGEAGNALTGDSATAFFSAGQIEAARGGTAVDSSGSTGVPRVSAGTWTFNAGISHLAASTSADLRGVLSDETGTGGAAVFATAPTIDSPTFTTAAILPNGAAPAPVNAGDIAVDTDDKCIVIGTGGTDTTRLCNGSGLVDYVKVTSSGTQSITSGTPAVLNFDTETEDTAGFHDTVTNNSRLTVPAGHAGVYAIACGVVFAANATGYRNVQFQVNGASVAGSTKVMAVTTGSNATNLLDSSLIRLSANDYVECLVDQNSGGALNVNNSVDTFLAAYRLDPGAFGSPAQDYVRVTKSATQSITNATSTAVTWDQETEDAQGFHDNVTSNTKLIVPAGHQGVYAISCSLGYATTAGAGLRYTQLKVNGSASSGMIAAQGQLASAVNDVATPGATAIYRMAAGDFAECYAYQSSGAGLNVAATNAASVSAPTEFQMYRLDIGPGAAQIHRVKLRKSATQSLTSASAADVTWDTEDFDTDAYHSGSNATFVVPAGLSGLYAIDCSLLFAASSTGDRECSLLVNGTQKKATKGRAPADATKTGETSTSWLLYLNDADSVKVQGYQDSGGALNITNDDSRTSLTATLLAGPATMGNASVEDIDSAPNYAGIIDYQFDQADGFVITNPASGIARIDLASIPNAALASSYSGVGTCTNQLVSVLNANAAPTCHTIVGADFGSSVAARTTFGNATAAAAAPAFSTTVDAVTYKTVEIPANMFVTGDFTTAANTNLQNITGLTWTIPASTAVNIPFSCHLLYSQATATAAVSFGIQDVTVAPTQINAYGVIYTSATTPTAGNLTALATTTATAIVTATPSAITTIWEAELHGMIEAPSNASSSAINIMVKTATSGDAVTVKRGSFCTVGF